MKCGKFAIAIALVFFNFNSASAYEKVYEDQVPRQEGISETIFVVEMIRHAARAGKKDDAKEVYGVEKEQITSKGK